MKIFNFTPALFAVLLAGCAHQPGTDSVIFLRNGNAEVGVHPNGGAVVIFRRPGSANTLAYAPKPGRANRQDHDLLGHTLWLSPQQEWWNQQAEFPEKLGRDWPPDPWLTAKRYRVVKRSGQHVTLRSPRSPISGVTLEKSFTLRNDGSLKIETTATNFRPRPVRWGLWSNTRVDPRTILRIMGKVQTSRTEASLLQGVTASAGTTTIRPPRSPLAGKLFFTAPEAVVQLSSPGGNWQKSAPELTPRGVHPSQSLIEIYRRYGSEKGEVDLLEAEFHGPVEEIPPGGQIRLREIWQWSGNTTTGSSSRL